MELIIMVNDNFKYSELTSKIIGSACKVHSFLGNGFQPGRRNESNIPKGIRN